MAAMPTMGWLRSHVAGRAVEAGVAVGEDAAVGGHQPVALAVGRRGHSDDGLVERLTRTCRRTEEGGAVVRAHRSRAVNSPVTPDRIGRHVRALSVKRRHRVAGERRMRTGGGAVARFHQLPYKNSSRQEDERADEQPQ